MCVCVCVCVCVGCTHGDIRLAGGNSSLEGHVEVCYDEVWGTVCSQGWGNIDAAVVCRQLGFLSTGRYHKSMHYIND